jgi:hypothetical protein
MGVHNMLRGMLGASTTASLVIQTMPLGPAKLPNVNNMMNVAIHLMQLNTIIMSRIQHQGVITMEIKHIPRSDIIMNLASMVEINVNLKNI